jgi:hypothetical protein
VRDDEVMLGLDRDLHIVADDARAAAAGRHRAAVGIGERDLLVGGAEFVELTHYYRMTGVPREQQNWLASVWRSCASQTGLV